MTALRLLVPPPIPPVERTIAETADALAGIATELEPCPLDEFGEDDRRTMRTAKILAESAAGILYALLERRREGIAELEQPCARCHALRGEHDTAAPYACEDTGCEAFDPSRTTEVIPAPVRDTEPAPPDPDAPPAGRTIAPYEGGW